MLSIKGHSEIIRCRFCGHEGHTHEDCELRELREKAARLEEAEQLLEEAWPYVVEHDMSLNSRIRKLLDEGSY